MSLLPSPFLPVTPKEATMLSDLLPPKVRKTVYAALGSINALVAIPGLIPAPIAAKVLAVLAALGFGLASGNVPKS